MTQPKTRSCLPAALTSSLLLLLAATLARGAYASEDDQVFNRATQALQSERYSEAIELLEQLSDRGVVRVNASHNRALAYLLRAESPKRKPGDLGQASAALREELLLDPSHSAAENALGEVSREISRQRAQRGLDPVVVEPPLSYAFVNLLPENAWAWAALLGSLALSVGLVLRTRPSDSPARLAGQIATLAGAVCLSLFGAVTFLAQQQSINLRPAVVVVAEAALLDAQGARQSAKALGVDSNSIPEGAAVLVSASNGRLMEVSWGSFKAWVSSTDLRLLAQP